MPEQPHVHHAFEIQGVAAMQLVRFRGTEALSELYAFRVLVVSEDAAIGFDDVVGRDALLTVTVGENARHFHGIVSRFEQGDAGKGNVHYEATIVPRVHRLTRRHDSRIFQELAVPDIIGKVLGAAGIKGSEYRLSLNASYAPREYCVQYRETDWAFLCRLMEEEGIHYFFEHTSDGHVVVFGDAPSAHKPIPGPADVIFRPVLGALSHGEHVHAFRPSEEIVTGKVTLRDWTFKKPELLLEGQAQASHDGDLEAYDFPGEYDQLADASPYAKIRLEQHQAVRRTAKGEGACARFCPGSLFNPIEHTRDEANRTWLLVRVEHSGASPHMAEATTDAQAYANTFVCMPSDVPFRAWSRTPRPTIKGIQTAIVVGPAGEEIYTDEHGRVKVQFHWDRQGKRDAKSSCWIRVSQIWAGPAWGAIYIPRIGHEVVVDFLEGDPDRPLVVGRVYHAANVPPYPLPADKTRSTIKSSSSPGGGGFNELRFEDKAGHEEIYLHAQKDLTIHVLHDENAQIDNDESRHVARDQSITVDNDQAMAVGRDASSLIGRDGSATVGRNETVSVGGDRTLTVSGNQTISVGADEGYTVGGKFDQAVGSDVTITIGGGRTETIAKNSELKVDGDATVTVDGKRQVAIKKTESTVIDEDAEETVKKNKTITVGEKVVIECGDAKVTLVKDGTITIEGKDITVKGTGSITVKADKSIDIKASSAITVKSDASVTIKGSTIGMN